jgi:enoyl-CoA hydratase/carnithine racemase
MANLTTTDEIFVIDFGDDENVTTDSWAVDMHALLDEVEAAEGPKVLVTTGSGKHYSNGLDVPYMASVEMDEISAYVKRIEKIVSRLMLFPAPTVAAVNGHAFGMGAFLVLAHDQAVMREDRGYFCLPEVHLQMSFPRSLMSVLEATLPNDTRRHVVLTGHRFSGPECVEAGVVDAVASAGDLVEAAIARGRPHGGTAGPNLGVIKHQLFAEVADYLGA